MGKNFYISDLHLFHDNVLKGGRFHERPFETMEEMLSEIKKRWNNVVTNGDTVYILGDVAIRGNTIEVTEYLSQLKGQLVLIRGNHDSIKDQRLLKQFTEICDYKEIADHVDGNTYRVVMSHYPLFSWNGQFRGSIHLYGHVHDNIDDEMYQAAIRAVDQHFANRDGERHKKFMTFNVGCMMDYMDYTPRTLKEILEKERNT